MARGLTDEGVNFGLLSRCLVVFGRIGGYLSFRFLNCDVRMTTPTAKMARVSRGHYRLNAQL